MRQRKLGRTADKRKHLLRGLACGLVIHGKTVTTIAKAKELKVYFDSTMSRVLNCKDSIGAKRTATKLLGDKKAIDVCIKKLRSEYKDRKGGYTKLIKIGSRTGDGTAMAKLELVK